MLYPILTVDLNGMKKFLLLGIIILFVLKAESFWLPPPPHLMKSKTTNDIKDLDIEILLQKDLAKIINAMIEDSLPSPNRNGPAKVPMLIGKFHKFYNAFLKVSYPFLQVVELGMMIGMNNCCLNTNKIIQFLGYILHPFHDISMAKNF